MKAMLCQPMNGRTEEEIQNERIKITRKLLNEGYEIVYSSIMEDPPENSDPDLWYLGQSIGILSQVDCLICLPNWRKYRGCRIERKCAIEYGKAIRYIDKI